MIVSQANIKTVDVKTKVSQRTDSQGRRRTTQRHTYTLEFDDGSTALFLGNGSFKRKDKLRFVSQSTKDGKTLILAYKNFTQKQQGPSQQELRGTIGASIIIFLVGFVALFAGLPFGNNDLTAAPIFIGSAIIFYGVYFIMPTLKRVRAVRLLNKQGT